MIPDVSNCFWISPAKTVLLTEKNFVLKKPPYFHMKISSCLSDTKTRWIVESRAVPSKTDRLRVQKERNEELHKRNFCNPSKAVILRNTLLPALRPGFWSFFPLLFVEVFSLEHMDQGSALKMHNQNWDLNGNLGFRAIVPCVVGSPVLGKNVMIRGFDTRPYR